MKYIALLLLGCNFLLLYLFATGRQANLMGQSIVPAGGDSRLMYGAEQEPSPFTLYIFMHADGNCPCLEDWVNWVDIDHKYEGMVTVKAIFNGIDKQKAIGFCKGMGLPFPLFEDKDGLRQRYHVQTNTLVKVLVDPNGNVLFLDTNQQSPKDQKYFLERLETHLATF